MKTRKLKNLKIKSVVQFKSNMLTAGLRETDPITVTTIAVTHLGNR